MKTKISRIGKRSLAIVLTMMLVVSMMLVGMVTANAWNVSEGAYIYFDNTVTGWSSSYVQIMIGHGSYSNCYNMSKITGTNIYYYKMPKWDGATQIAFIGNSSAWGTSNTESPDHRNGYATNHTGVYYLESNWTSGNYYLFRPSAKANDSALNAPTSNTNVQNLFAKKQTLSTKYNGSVSNTFIADMKITASVMKTYNTIETSTANSYGEVSQSYDNAALGTSVTLSYGTPISGYVFDGWYLGTTRVSTDATYTYTVTGTAIYYANFKQATVTKYSVTTSSVTNGTLTSDKATASAGETVTITAKPNTGYKCDGITVTPSCDVTDNGNGTYSFEMPSQAVSVSATFSPVATSKYTVTTSDTTNGSISADVTEAASGETVTITVDPEAGYECTGVTTSPSTTVNKNSDGTYSFTMPAANVTVSATFTQQLESGEYTITKTPSQFGTMTLANSSNLKDGTANAGDVITVTVNTLKGYACKTLTATTESGEVTVNANEDDTYTFTMPAENVTLTATFEPTEITYSLSDSVSNATITFSTASSSSAKTAKPGEKVTMTITPNSGYICSSYDVLDLYGNALECEKLSSLKCTFIMPECDVTVTATMTAHTPDPNHTFRVYFKSPSAKAYQPKVSVDGGSFTAMTKDKELGKIYSGALTIYWYYCDVTVDTSTATTLTFKTNRTNLNASITDYFTGTEYYLAVDDLMNGKEVVDLTSMPEYVRNYYRSATHMVYPYNGASDTTDNTLGFTNVGGVRYKMGSKLIDGKVSIMSATLMQKVSAETETADDVQMALLDVNLDGRVDVRDATLTQKYLVSA